MSKLNYLITGNNKIAYRYYKRSKKNLVFIHGLMSDMNGQKSTFLNSYCRKKKISFLCFDFRGHGKSSGEFINFGIGDWYDDLKNLLKFLKLKDIILVGSSMGGWVAMLYALNFSKNVDKLIGIAAAPDFTKNLLWKELNQKEKKLIKSKKVVERKISNEFTYYYSFQLFENSKKYFIQDSKKKFIKETILFHGEKDNTIPRKYNDNFYKNSKFSKLVNITIKNSDHSMSDPLSLETISKFI